jgi:hypothetical protein
MANYEDTPLDGFILAFETAWENAGDEADALFGKSEEPPAAELEIIFHPRLTFTDKLAKLQVLRGEAVKPRSFDCRLTDGDRLHARALGIHLEDEMEQGRR